MRGTKAKLIRKFVKATGFKDDRQYGITDGMHITENPNKYMKRIYSSYNHIERGRFSEIAKSKIK